jgi:hypothetical protein
MRADSHTVLDPDGPGRDSIRIRSQKTWKHGVYVYVQASVLRLERVLYADKLNIGLTFVICLKVARHGRLLGLSPFVRFLYLLDVELIWLQETGWPDFGEVCSTFLFGLLTILTIGLD